MKYCILDRGDDNSRKIKAELVSKLEANGAIYNEVYPDFIISVGGDGTMLRAIHRFFHLIDHVAFIGLHTGTLGFFTNYTTEQMDVLVDNLLHKSPSIEEFPLLEVSFNTGEKVYAVNEVRIENNYHTQAIEMKLNGEYLQTFNGTGICIATALGSTGYSRSLYGPIVEPTIPCMILTEIAGIQHRFHATLSSPLVMDKDSSMDMKMLNEDNHTIVGVDHEIYENISFTELSCCLSKLRVRMVSFDDLSYVKRLRKAFFENKSNN